MPETEGAADGRFLNPQSTFHHRLLPGVIAIVGTVTLGANAGGLFPPINIPWWWWRRLFQDAAAAD